MDLCDGDADGLDPPGSDDDKGRVWWRMTWVGTCASSESDMVGMCVEYGDMARMGDSRCGCAFFIEKSPPVFKPIVVKIHIVPYYHRRLVKSAVTVVSELAVMNYL